MNAADKDRIANFHNQVIAEFGVGTVCALGWLTNESQQARFKIFSQLGNFAGKSVLDAGCGHADLLPYLRGLYTTVAYTGVEQLPILLNVAIERYGHFPNINFIAGDFSEDTLPVADYVIACGSLSYSNTDPRYLVKTIERLFACSRLGFGFNLLSSIEHPDPAVVFYNPDEIMAFCKTLCTDARLVAGYWENDFTILMPR